MIQGSRAPETRLDVSTLLSNQQHVPQVRDVAGGQTQRLNLRQLPVSWFGRYQRPQRSECRVHTVRAIPLSGVCSVSLAYLDDLRTELAGSCYGSAAEPLFASGQLKCAVDVAGHLEGLVVRSRTLTAVVIIFGVHADLRAQEMSWGWSHHRKRHAQHLMGPLDFALCPCVEISIESFYFAQTQEWTQSKFLIVHPSQHYGLHSKWLASVNSPALGIQPIQRCLTESVLTHSFIRNALFSTVISYLGSQHAKSPPRRVCVNEFVSSRSFSSMCDFSWAFPYALDL